MSQWFPVVDDALGGAADVVEDTGSWVFGGIGSTVGGAVEGTGDVVGDTTGQLLGGAFRGLGRWLLIALGLTLGAVVVMRVM